VDENFTSTILIVDDEPAIRVGLEELLTAEGYTVACASTGAEAMTKAAELTPDLIMLDVMMPDMDGFAVCRRLRADALLAEAPIIMVTALADHDSRLRGFEAGADDYISKPIDIHELLARVRTTTRLNRYRRLLTEQTRRQQAEEALQRQLEELVVLHAVARAGAETVSEDVLIERATQMMDRLLDADCFGVFLLDETAGVLRAHPSYRPCGPGTSHIVPLGGRHIVGQVAADGRPRYIPDLDDETEHWEAIPEIRSMLCAPLPTGERIIGAVNAGSARRDAFSADDERLMVTFANQLATAIEKVRLMNTLEQRVADRTQELAALYDVTAIAAESLDLDPTLERMLGRTLEAVGSAVGAIHLLDEEGETLRLAARRGPPAEGVTQMDSIPVDGDLVSWVVEHGKPVVVPAAPTAPHATWTAYAEESPTYVGVPVRGRGRMLGALSVLLERTEAPFKVEDLALLASIADHLGVVVENARLHQQAERAAVMEERERMARELHDSVTQSLYSVTLLAETGRRSASAGELENTAHYLARLNETTQQALKEMRLMIYELRPLALEREGLVGALQQRLDAVEKRAGIESRLLVMIGDDVELAAPVEEELYRIAQEALNNSLRHAAATTVTVYIYAKDERVEMEIVDNGKGFDPGATQDRGGLGLIGIRERAAKIGGSLTLQSAPGEGTTVRVAIGY
jgi:signal transduction histidine kinase/DNA-binding response OmpR family regulator